MPKYKVRCRVDAYVNYLAEVEAESPADAAELAQQSPGEFQWEREGISEFDARGYVALGDDGWEIDETMCGDFG